MASRCCDIGRGEAARVGSPDPTGNVGERADLRRSARHPLVPLSGRSSRRPRQGRRAFTVGPPPGHVAALGCVADGVAPSPAPARGPPVKGNDEADRGHPRPTTTPRAAPGVDRRRVGAPREHHHPDRRRPGCRRGVDRSADQHHRHDLALPRRRHATRDRGAADVRAWTAERRSTTPPGSRRTGSFGAKGGKLGRGRPAHAEDAAEPVRRRDVPAPNVPTFFFRSTFDTRRPTSPSRGRRARSATSSTTTRVRRLDQRRPGRTLRPTSASPTPTNLQYAGNSGGATRSTGTFTISPATCS